MARFSRSNTESDILGSMFTFLGFPSLIGLVSPLLLINYFSCLLLGCYSCKVATLWSGVDFMRLFPLTKQGNQLFHIGNAPNIRPGPYIQVSCNDCGNLGKGPFRLIRMTFFSIRMILCLIRMIQVRWII